jgi:hypothetical protein
MNKAYSAHNTVCILPYKWILKCALNIHRQITREKLNKSEQEVLGRIAFSPFNIYWVSDMTRTAQKTVLLLLCIHCCGEGVYRAIAEQEPSPLALLFWLSGITSYWCTTLLQPLPPFSCSSRTGIQNLGGGALTVRRSHIFLILKLATREGIQTHRQQGDLIIILSFFHNNGSRLKINSMYAVHMYKHLYV